MARRKRHTSPAAAQATGVSLRYGPRTQGVLRRLLQAMELRLPSVVGTGLKSISTEPSAFMHRVLSGKPTKEVSPTRIQQRLECDHTTYLEVYSVLCQVLGYGRSIGTRKAYDRLHRIVTERSEAAQHKRQEREEPTRGDEAPDRRMLDSHPRASGQDPKEAERLRTESRTIVDARCHPNRAKGWKYGKRWMPKHKRLQGQGFNFKYETYTEEVNTWKDGEIVRTEQVLRVERYPRKDGGSSYSRFQNQVPGF